jgi:prepilin peptidase CpaA
MLQPAHWPLVVISVAMVVAAVIDGWKLKVPNWLTYPIILTGWLLGAVYDFTQPPSPLGQDQLESGSRFLAAVGNTFFGFLIFLPVYAIGGVGAGDVKMQMGYGSWMGAYCGLYQGMSIVGWGYLVGIVVGGVLGLGIMFARREFAEYRKNAGEILKDLATSGGNIAEVAEKAAKRKKRQTLLPYGIPLCIGYLGYFWLYYYNP